MRGFLCFICANISSRNWDVTTFIFSYAMVGVFPIIFIVWKLVKRTKWLRPEDVVLRTPEVDEIDAYTAEYAERPAATMMQRWLDKLWS